MKKNSIVYSRKSILFLFIVPAVLLYTAVVIYPLFRGFAISLTNLNIFGTKNDFIGLKNYMNLFSDTHFIHSVIFTIKYAFVYVIMMNVIALAIALAVDSSRIGKPFLRSCFFLPNMLSGVIVAFVWKFIFGIIIPEFIQTIGIESLKLSFFGSSEEAFRSVMFVVLWQNLGFFVVIFTAGLQTIPTEIYEVSKIDGIGWFKKATRIQIPLLASTITINLFISITGAFKQFDLLFALTQGGPARSTETNAYNVSLEAFSKNNLGAGSAKGIVLLLFIVTITFFQLRLTSKKEVQL